MSHFLLRPRIQPQALQVSNGAAQILQGIFGVGGPTAYAFADVSLASNMSPVALYHEGDLFTPGAQNFVFESVFEFYPRDLKGNGFYRRANTFSPRQSAQAFTLANTVKSGLGGLQAGQFHMTQLSETEGGGT